MATSKKREVLERYRNLLENNLVLSDDLLRWFKEKKALPDFIFEDIKVGALPDLSSVSPLPLV